ncbi:MAG: hypothetical protein JWO13_2738 [Acidobacteriales bacterium]|nr:hypothetical protein [Terriglobales bacterium]
MAVDLEQIDAALKKAGVPVMQRPVRAWRELVISMGDAAPPIDIISDWFFNRYGERVSWDGIVGLQPVAIRDMVGVVKVPFISETTTLRVTEYVDGIPSEILTSLSESEMHALLGDAMAAFYDFKAVYNLHSEPSILSREEWQLVDRAMFDLAAASTLLQVNQDTQGCVFSIQQASEKFIKAALSKLGKTPKRGHAIKDFLDDLIKEHYKFNYLRRAVDEISSVTMNVRYAQQQWSLSDTLRLYSAGRMICGFIAQQWQLDQERGPVQTVLTPGHWYRDYDERISYCVSIGRTNGRDTARMLVLDVDAGPIGKISAEVLYNADLAFHYVTITESVEIARLEKRRKSLEGQS